MMKALQRKCGCGGATHDGAPCSGCVKKRNVQRKAAGEFIPDRIPPIVHEVLGSSGRPLDRSTLAFMEPRFGHDFSGVRVHTGERASASARAVGAVAYTVGRDVVFADHRYAPATTEGRRLLAHELTHVVQQSNAAPGGHEAPIGAVNDSAEQAADAAAERVMKGEGPPHLARAAFALRRDVGWAQRGPDPYGTLTAPWGVRVLSANIVTNSIALRFGPSGSTGTMTLALTGAPGVRHVIRTAQRSAGDVSENFDIANLTPGDYVNAEATYVSGGSTYINSHALVRPFRVLGRFRHSQYNIPAEASCGGSPQPVYITNNSCVFTPATLLSGFVAQLNLNGSGISAAHGNLTREAFCLGRNNAPANAAGRSFRVVPAFHGGCGAAAGLNNSTVANCRTRPDLGCGDEVLLDTAAAPTVKTVTDYCPACCGHNQLDNFTTNTACAGIADLGNFMTLKLLPVQP